MEFLESQRSAICKLITLMPGILCGVANESFYTGNYFSVKKREFHFHCPCMVISGALLWQNFASLAPLVDEEAELPFMTLAGRLTSMSSCFIN